MARRINDRFEDSTIIEVCKNSISMSEASRKLGMNFKTLRKKAVELGCFETNMSGKGISKPNDITIPLEDILNNKITKNYKSSALKGRLFLNNLLENVCSSCGIKDVWNEKPIVLELHHIDGNNKNNNLENLQILCPNCHSQTHNFRGRNTNSGVFKVSDEVLLETIIKNDYNMSKSLKECGIGGGTGNIKRCCKLLEQHYKDKK